MALPRSKEVAVHTFADGGGASRADFVATEEPLEIRIDGEALAVVMRTPGDDIALAAGFLLAEGIVREADDLASIRHCTRDDADEKENIIEVTLEAGRRGEASARLAQHRAERATVTSSSCGVCGKRSIESLQVDAPAFHSDPRFDPRRILSFPERLREAQAVFSQTGGLHAAAVFDAAGELLVLKEDVGRHNAVDKCIGTLLIHERLPVADATLMVSGRTSFEIVQKALVARIQSVAAVSAPSSLAVELARASRMGLVGFVRGESLNVYAGELE